MIAYRDLIQILIGLFTIFTLLSLPAFFFFKNSYEGYGPTASVGYAKYSLGNFGYSDVFCQSVPVSI